MAKIYIEYKDWVSDQFRAGFRKFPIPMVGDKIYDMQDKIIMPINEEDVRRFNQSDSEYYFDDYLSGAMVETEVVETKPVWMHFLKGHNQLEWYGMFPYICEHTGARKFLLEIWNKELYHLLLPIGFRGTFEECKEKADVIVGLK